MASNKCSDFDTSYAKMLEIEKAIKDFKSVTGEDPDPNMLAKTLYAITDLDTQEKMEKDDDCDIESYSSMKDWYGEKWEKQAGIRVIKSNQKSSKMQVGALDMPEAAAAAAASEAADPWAGADPWSAGMPCPPCADLDAFGKGEKGAFGKGKKPLDCWNCFGRGHPAFACASPPDSGQNKTDPQCTVCKGYGHQAPACTSPGGGRYVAPTKGTRKNTPKGGGKTGYFPKGGFGKGGKGMHSLEDWPTTASYDPWASAAAAAAAGQELPPPWIEAAQGFTPPGLSIFQSPGAGAPWRHPGAQWPTTPPSSSASLGVWPTAPEGPWAQAAPQAHAGPPLRGMSMLARKVPVPMRARATKDPVKLSNSFARLEETPSPLTMYDCINWKSASPASSSIGSSAVTNPQIYLLRKICLCQRRVLLLHHRN